MKLGIETRKTILKELVEKGKSKGLLTYKEITEAFDEYELETEQIEKIYETLENMGLDVIGDIEAEMEDIQLNEEDMDTEYEMFDIFRTAGEGVEDYTAKVKIDYSIKSNTFESRDFIIINI